MIFGVAFGNLLQGVPFTFDDTLRAAYTGSFWALLNPFALLCGLVSSAMITFQGATFLMLRTETEVRERARHAAWLSGLTTAALFIVAGVWVSRIAGYSIVSGAAAGADSNPLAKVVVTETGAWLANYAHWPILWLLPVLGIATALGGASLRAWAKPAWPLSPPA